MQVAGLQSTWTPKHWLFTICKKKHCCILILFYCEFLHWISRFLSPVFLALNRNKESAVIVLVSVFIHGSHVDQWVFPKKIDEFSSSLYFLEITIHVEWWPDGQMVRRIVGSFKKNICFLHYFPPTPFRLVHVQLCMWFFVFVLKVNNPVELLYI